MLKLLPEGLFCSAGNFFIDPSRGVENAVITHAHSDHARRGSQKYYCVSSGESLLRMETNNEVWVASGDYKRDFDPTCEPFEVVSCDVFVTEATFGTPRYRWKKDSDIGSEIFEWWEKNSSNKLNSVLFAYSLGKAQRILGLLNKYPEVPIYCHTTISTLNVCYKNEGVQLAATTCLGEIDSLEPLEGKLFLVPKYFLKTDRVHILGSKFQTAFASGWISSGDNMYSQSYEHGFVLSDHADWDDLVKTVVETGAKKVYVQHRNGKLVRHLKTLGIKAYPDTDLIVKQQTQMTLF